MIEFHLCCILLILIILLILKLYLQKSKKETQILKDSKKCTKKDCKCKEDILPLLNQMKNSTDKKINDAIEQGIIEGYRSMNNDSTSDITRDITSDKTRGNVSNTSIMSYINKDDNTKLMLFYKTSCSYCMDFLPVWYEIINKLPNNIMYEEINADKDNESNKITNSNNITSVPTIILLINNEKKVYTGQRTYQNIARFLQTNGINLVEKTFEKFDDSGYSTEPEPTKPLNNDCPDVTFDSQFDFAQDNYMYQIFDKNGQYGYATGGNNKDKIMKPFSAAYSVVDSYLSSLPDTKKMNKCATLYSKEINGFGLCNSNKLDEISNYQDQINSGKLNVRISGTNYDTNSNVVAAIKTACSL